MEDKIVMGINIDLKGFQKLPSNQKLDTLFLNTEELKTMVRGYKFQQKMQWATIVFLAGVMGLGKVFNFI
jgi:hypothetical protein